LSYTPRRQALQVKDACIISDRGGWAADGDEDGAPRRLCRVKRPGMLGAGQWLQFGAATVERTCRQGRVAAESHDGARAHGGGIYAPRGTGVRHLLAAAEGKVTARKGLRGAIYPSLLTACHVEAHRLLQNNPRIISLNGPIDDATSSTIVAQLLFLEAEDPDRTINMYINSPGGVITSGLAIYDTMQYIKCPVTTICMGQACSMASLLLAAGEPGQRKSLPNARVMVHQPIGGAQGQASDIAIHAEEILKMRKRLESIYASHIGKDAKEIGERLERDYFMTAEEAKDFGIVDEVLQHRSPGSDAS